MAPQNTFLENIVRRSNGKEDASGGARAPRLGGGGGKRGPVERNPKLGRGILQCGAALMGSSGRFGGERLGQAGSERGGDAASFGLK